MFNHSNEEITDITNYLSEAHGTSPPNFTKTLLDYPRLKAFKPVDGATQYGQYLYIYRLGEPEIMWCQLLKLPIIYTTPTGGNCNLLRFIDQIPSTTGRLKADLRALLQRPSLMISSFNRQKPLQCYGPKLGQDIITIFESIILNRYHHNILKIEEPYVAKT